MDGQSGSLDDSCPKTPARIEPELENTDAEPEDVVCPSGGEKCKGETDSVVQSRLAGMRGGPFIIALASEIRPASSRSWAWRKLALTATLRVRVSMSMAWLRRFVRFRRGVMWMG